MPARANAASLRRLPRGLWLADSKERKKTYQHYPPHDMAPVATAEASPADAVSAKPLRFSSFDVTEQAFYTTDEAAAIVNLKPVVPGRACDNGGGG